MRLRAKPIPIPVLLVAVLMVVFCTPAASSQNTLQPEPFLGYFGDSVNIRWGSDTGQPYYDANRWWYLPSAQGGIFEATLYVESRQDEKQINYAFQALPWPSTSEKPVERKGTTAGTPGPFAEMRRDDATRGFIEVGKISITVPAECQLLQISASRVFLASPVFNGADTVVTLGQAPVYAGGNNNKPYWGIKDMSLLTPFGGTVSFTGYLRVYAGEPSTDDTLSIKYPPKAVLEAPDLKATWADAVDIQWDSKSWGFAPIGRFTVDVPPGFQHVKLGTKRSRIVISDVEFSPNPPVTVPATAGGALVYYGSTPYQGKSTGKLYYLRHTLILPHAEGGTLEMDLHARLSPVEVLPELALKIVSYPLGPTLLEATHPGPIQADLAEMVDGSNSGFTPPIQRIRLEIPKGTSILKFEGSDRSFLANIKFTSALGTTSDILTTSGNYIQGSLSKLAYTRAGSIYLPDKAGGTVSFNVFFESSVAEKEREDRLEVARPENLSVAAVSRTVTPSDILDLHMESPDYGYAYVGTMTVTVPEGQDRIDFRTKGNRVFLSQIVYTRAGQPIVEASPPRLVTLPSVSPDAGLGAAAAAQPAVASTPAATATLTGAAPPAPGSTGTWGYELEAQPPRQRAVLDIDRLDTVIQEFSDAIAKAEAAKSAHPAFIDHLRFILASLVGYRNALIENNPDDEPVTEWGQY